MRLLILAILFFTVNAISLDHHHLIARQFAQPQKRSTGTGRCKPRPTSSSTTTPKYTPAAPAAPSPAAPSPSPSPSPSSSSASSDKIGIAWPNGNDPSLRNYMKPGRVTYTWGINKPEPLDGGDFAIMLWGNNDGMVQQFKDAAQPGFAKYALGFNEPELPYPQAALDPQTAAQLWIEAIQPLKNQGYMLGTPAITSDSGGIPWMKSFLSACGGQCTFDFACFHFYGTNAQDFITYVTNFHNTFNLPVWVTEFASWNFDGSPQLDQGQVYAFMNTVTQWMDATEWVERYFSFGIMHDMGNVGQTCSLMNADGTPNTLGNIYLYH